MQLRRGGGAQAQELAKEGSHLGFRPPKIIALKRAFAGHLHHVDSTNDTEVLQQRAVGQPGGEASVVLPEQDSADITAQSPLAVELMILLSLGADPFALAQPAAEVFFQQLGFQAALDEQPFDAQQLIPEFPVIDVALDGGQDLRQGRLEGNNSRVWHWDRV